MTDSSKPKLRKNTADVTNSGVVTSVFDSILADIQSGLLVPGELIRDGEIADQLGVSRTPVREALQRLREIGVIEASRGVFTRIADVTPGQAAQASLVWQVLLGALFAEVAGNASPEVIARMTADNQRFLAALEILDMENLAMASIDFFERLLSESENPALQRAITSVSHIVRLGSINAPEWFDFASVAQTHASVLKALRSGDPDAIREAVALIVAIPVPAITVETPSPLL